MVIGPDGQPRLPWLAPALRRALAQVRGHATLVHGAAGEGFELAVALAQAWLCEADGDGPRPCGRCAACRLMQAHGHPDFHLLLPEALREPLGWSFDGEGGGADTKKAKPSRELRVEQVRAAIDWSHQTSARGRAKVVLIHPAQAMNTVAANALLKTLEEPPGLLRLLLCTQDPQALLPTVRSRCQRLELSPPPRDEALAWLAGQGVARPEVLHAAAGGHVLEALAMQQAGIDAAAWEALPVALRDGRPAGLAGWPLPRAVDALQKLCHDLTLAAVGASPRYFAPTTLPAGAEVGRLVAWQDALRRASRHDEHPWNAPLLVESLVLQGAAAWPAPAARGGGPGRFATLPAR